MTTPTNDKDYLTNSIVLVEEANELALELTVVEISLTESLLTPGLQSSVTFQNKINMDGYNKNLNGFYNKDITILAERPIIEKMYNDVLKSKFATKQKIYRLSRRERVNYNIEQFTLEACDPSLLKDAQTYVSHSWDCVSPDTIVKDVLTNCIGNANLDIEDNVGPKRGYIAENIHPFQVITQQEEVSLADNQMDPSFVHFMTYQNTAGDDIPTHNYKSLTRMALQKPTYSFTYSGKKSTPDNYAMPNDIMNFMFPCDFDALSDILNGVDINSGAAKSQMNIFNPLIDQHSVMGPYSMDANGCGTAPWFAVTNMTTESETESCDVAVDKYAPLRRARMALLDQDKVALRLVIPFAPFLNAGRVIHVDFINYKLPDSKMYASGDYLIASMTHNLKMGGMGTTTIDCVAETVAAGIQ